MERWGRLVGEHPCSHAEQYAILLGDPVIDELLRFSRILTRVIEAGLGGIGIFALVCSALHPHPDAALMAIIMLAGATLLTVVRAPQ